MIVVFRRRRRPNEGPYLAVCEVYYDQKYCHRYTATWSIEFRMSNCVGVRSVQALNNGNAPKRLGEDVYLCGPDHVVLHDYSHYRCNAVVARTLSEQKFENGHESEAGAQLQSHR